MPRYRYIQVQDAAGSIRLFRLLPSDNDRATIRGELLEYNLQASRRATHAYEALSYVWGHFEEHASLLIGDDELDVTPNLHAALLQLRDTKFPRILWIDDICINQQDNHEKEHQIQRMAQIYGTASQVVVWLGKVADDSDEAIDAIRTASRAPNRLAILEGYALSEHLDINSHAVDALLRRQWFRRIWVLQEVSAARHILMLCGTAEIDGYAFCIGVENIGNSQRCTPSADDTIRAAVLRATWTRRLAIHSANVNLTEERYIHPVAGLIKGAIFRSRADMSDPAIKPLDMSSLGELLDKYHRHQATKDHDKIYALLGMTSMESHQTDLMPDYRVPWSELLEKAIWSILGKQVHVFPWANKQRAEIYGKGYVLGEVGSITRGTGGMQDVQIYCFPQSRRVRVTLVSRWILPPTAIALEYGDIVCLLQGASGPTIIRSQHECDHFLVVMIGPRSFGAMQVTSPLRDFLLVWDWNELPDRTEHAQQALDRVCGRLTRLLHVTLILKDVKDHEDAEKKMVDAIRVNNRPFNDTRWFSITPQELSEVVQDFAEEAVLALLERARDE